MFKLKLLKFFHLISKKKYKKLKQVYIIKNSSLFDEKWYLEQYPDVAKYKKGAADHYLHYGWKEGRNPSPNFDTTVYLNKYMDVKQANVNPLVHYEKYGKKEGRDFIIKSISITEMKPTPVVKKVNKDYFFSVIVASYNYQDLIKETLDSLINQTYKNFEVIVVDDASKDNSVDVIKK